MLLNVALGDGDAEADRTRATSPAFAVHDKPSMSNDTAGMDDSGIVTCSAADEDYKAAAEKAWEGMKGGMGK